MRRLASLWPAALSAAILLAAFAPLNLSLLVFVALAPFFAALMKADKRQALWLGYAFGFVYMAGQMYMVQALVVRWTGSVFLSLVPWLITAFLGAWYFALFGWLAQRLLSSGHAWAVPFLWAGVEVFRSYIPGLAFPWGLLASPLWSLPPLIQSAYFGAIYLVSAWAATTNLLLGAWLTGERVRHARGLLGFFVVVLALSVARLAEEESPRKLVVTVGQLGVDMAFTDPAEQPLLVRDAVEGIYASARLAGSDLLVLPEGITEGGASLPPSTPFTVEPDVPVVFGGQRGVGPVFQSAFGYEDGRWTYVDKTRLVIFGEYVPGRSWLPFLGAFQLPQGDISPGEELGQLNVANTSIGPVICFEALFPDVTYRQALGGAQMLAVLSVDDWYMETPAPQQLRAASVWRSVETGLPLVRSATLGHAIATDSHGRILAEAPVGRRVGMRVELPVPERPRPFPLFPVFPGLCLAVLVWSVLLPLRTLMRRSDSE